SNPSMGRGVFGTGFAGAETYSVASLAPPAGAVQASRPPGCRERRGGAPLAGGQRSNFRQRLRPVSNTVTGDGAATSAPFRYFARNGASTSPRKRLALSSPNSIAPSREPSAKCWPWYHGPATKKFVSFALSCRSSAAYTAGDAHMD